MTLTHVKKRHSTWERHLERRLAVVEVNLEQWARVDVHLGLEHQLRLAQALAIARGDQDEAAKIHLQRVLSLERAADALRKCPVCQDHQPVGQDDTPEEEPAP
jgi:hypothetical protein